MTRTHTCNEHAQSTLYKLFGQWVAAGSCEQCCARTALGVSRRKGSAQISVEIQANAEDGVSVIVYIDDFHLVLTGRDTGGAGGM